MKPREPLPIYHSWPLFECEQRLDLRSILGDATPAMTSAALSQPDGEELARHGIGIWECDLADNALTWSAGVYDIFGVPRGADIRRDDAVALYCDESRVVMESLRAYALRHKRGFTVDVEIRPSLMHRRWMRLTAMPVCEGNHVLRLYGLKQAL